MAQITFLSKLKWIFAETKKQINSEHVYMPFCMQRYVNLVEFLNVQTARAFQNLICELHNDTFRSYWHQ